MRFRTECDQLKPNNHFIKISLKSLKPRRHPKEIKRQIPQTWNKITNSKHGERQTYKFCQNNNGCDGLISGCVFPPITNYLPTNFKPYFLRNSQVSIFNTRYPSATFTWLWIFLFIPKKYGRFGFCKIKSLPWIVARVAEVEPNRDGIAFSDLLKHINIGRFRLLFIEWDLDVCWCFLFTF